MAPGDLRQLTARAAHARSEGAVSHIAASTIVRARQTARARQFDAFKVMVVQQDLAVLTALAAASQQPQERRTVAPFDLCLLSSASRHRFSSAIAIGLLACLPIQCEYSCDTALTPLSTRWLFLHESKGQMRTTGLGW